jgi:hypothetical protein
MLKALKEAANVTLFDTNGKPVLYADYMKSTGISYSMESQYAKRKGVNAIRWDSNREGQLTTQMEVYDPKWLALLFGTTFASSSIDVAKREVINVASGGTTSTALSTTVKSGSMYIFGLDDDGCTHLAEYTADVSTTPGTGKYYYDTGTKILKFNATDFATAGKVVVYYLTTTNVSNFKVTLDGYPAGYKMVMDTKFRGTNQVDTYHQITLPNVKPQSNLSLDLSDDSVATIEITWDILGDANGDMMIMADIS